MATKLEVTATVRKLEGSVKNGIVCNTGPVGSVKAVIEWPGEWDGNTERVKEMFGEYEFLSDIEVKVMD